MRRTSGSANSTASDYAKLAGLPVALIGVAGYLAILASLRLRPEVTALLAYIGAGFSAYLTWAELFRIEAICQWCVASAFIVVSIAALATLRALRAGDPRRAGGAGW